MNTVVCESRATGKGTMLQGGAERVPDANSAMATNVEMRIGGTRMIIDLPPN